jgi:multicomponent Na+:H+ antiporter subunit E
MTNLFGFNLLLAFGSCALLGGFTLANLVAGFLVGFATLSLTGSMFGKADYFGRVVRVARLGIYFAWELMVSSLQVVWDVLTPVQKSRPAIVAVPLDITDPTQITVLANLISLTPGSLSLDVSRDEKTLYVHGMFVDDPDQFRSHIKSGLERKVREAME